MSECDGCILENNPGGGCADAHRRGMCPTYGYELGISPKLVLSAEERCEDCGRPDCQHCE